MLTSNDNLRLDVIPSFNEMGSTTWRSVNLELWIPYAFITYSIEQDSVWLSQTSIFWIEEDILKFFGAFHGDQMRKIIEIALLLPTGIEKNRLERRWVKIKEVWSYQSSESMGPYPVYISMEGERIGANGNTTVVITKQNAALLYRARRRPVRAKQTGSKHSIEPKDQPSGER